MTLLAHSRTTFLFVNVVTADQALKLALGSTVISLWVIFYAIAVLVSMIGIHPSTHAFMCSCIVILILLTDTGGMYRTHSAICRVALHNRVYGLFSPPTTL